MAGLGDRQSGFDGFEIAQLAYQHHVRVLAQCVTQRLSF